MNYFIDEGNLSIKEKNIFTAMETVTMIPVAGKNTCDSFLAENTWAFNHFPNMRASYPDLPEHAKQPLLKRCAEYFLKMPVFDKLEHALWRITAKRWRKKELTGALNKKGMRMSLITGKHYARPNPQLFQKRILRAYRDKMEELEEQRLISVHVK